MIVPTFTLCSFPAAFCRDLVILGSKPGRDSDKIVAQYLQMDYHRVFFAEILRIRGNGEFRKK